MTLELGSKKWKVKKIFFYFSLNAYGLGAWKVHTQYIFWKTMKFGKVANHCLKIQHERGKKKWCDQVATEMRQVWISTWGERWKFYEGCRQPVCFCLLVCYVYLFLYFGLPCVFAAAREPSLAVVNRGYSSLLCAGFSLWWLLLLLSTGSRV